MSTFPHCSHASVCDLSAVRAAHLRHVEEVSSALKEAQAEWKKTKRRERQRKDHALNVALVLYVPRCPDASLALEYLARKAQDVCVDSQEQSELKFQLEAT